MNNIDILKILNDSYKLITKISDKTTFENFCNELLRLDILEFFTLYLFDEEIERFLKLGENRYRRFTREEMEKKYSNFYKELQKLSQKKEFFEVIKDKQKIFMRLEEIIEEQEDKNIYYNFFQKKDVYLAGYYHEQRVLDIVFRPCNHENIEHHDIIGIILSIIIFLTGYLISLKLRVYSLKSAISAIMSRNLSHNIGSHVLAYLILERIERVASRITYKNEECNDLEEEEFCNILKTLYRELLSYNGADILEIQNKIEEVMKKLLKLPRSGIFEWIEDVKVFLQYLQHRMDFLANISTEWPKWTFSAWLMKDIIYYFLKQRILLDGIGKSEGLKGYYYDYKVVSLDNNEEKPIKFHIVKIKNNNIWEGNIKGSWEERKKDFNNEKGVILLESREDPAVNLYEDILLAIPGGIVGYHAFFVILENVIRNAAKHSFSKERHEALEIIIEIINDPAGPEEKWCVRIYDNVSSVCKECKCHKKITSVFNDNVKSPDECIIAYMNKFLRQPIIKETGELERTNWGIAEMKIAATYLQQTDIIVLGKGGDKITGSDKEEDDFIIRAICSPIGTLGYEFKMLKPKEVGIVCKRKGEEEREK